MANNTWVNLLHPHPAARGAAAATFTTARDISSIERPGSGANELRLGTKVILTARGEYSTTGTPTFRLGFAYGIPTDGGALSGGVELAGSDLVATVTTAAAWEWSLFYEGLVTQSGGTGVIYGSGEIFLASSLIAGATKPIPITAAARSKTIDTTSLQRWSVFAEWGTSNASNTVTCDIFNVLVLNAGRT